MYNMAFEQPPDCGVIEAALDFLRTYPTLPVVGLLIAGVAVWHSWKFALRPLLIPKSEVDAIVERLIAEYGPRAEEMAYAEEDRAWHDSNTYEQGRWRRVRRELWRRYARGEWEWRSTKFANAESAKTPGCALLGGRPLIRQRV